MSGMKASKISSNQSCKRWWRSFDCEGRLDFILAFKLKALKVKLREWSKSAQGNSALQKQNIVNQLAEFEEVQDQRTLGEEEIHSKAELKLEFENIAKYEEIAWRQRSRVNWLKQGDNNTKFFHRTANSHRRYNNIDELNVDKAHGLDGFTMAFYTYCWEVIGKDVIATVKNFHESYLWASHQLEQEFLVSSKVPNLPSLARILGGRTGDLPTTYLGMPLGAKCKSIGIWNGVIEKCEKRLANWKSQYLSLRGRLTLINSVLDSMPTYMMSLFPIPDGVIDRLDALRRNFRWEGNSETKKLHLVKWHTLIESKQARGWG
ncbi:hypothetical protein MTR67_000881 [Solanum verrucosum]|uniref:Uncharacterized protein n=1 Tax=Solanum verrucosum TaxID=315347 RepID=A0AAF0PRL9_SOLVR|nr:hypothetical protein MTR67_000881 [Solanum verrucosum]